MKPKYSIWLAELDAKGVATGAARDLINDIQRPTRLSPFPDGQRLLICHDEGLDVVNVKTGETSPLDWPKLHDPDLPQGQPLIITDAVLRPDGEEVVFSGLRWSGDVDDGA